VALIENNFRGDVLRCSANGEGSPLSQELSKPKVSKFEITVISNQKILRLEVSEDNIFAVQVFKATSDDRAVKTGLISCERLDVSQVCKELSSVY